VNAKRFPSLYDWSDEHDRQDLLREWDYTKNRPLMPYAVPAAARRLVWWKCHKGHKYQEYIRNRTEGADCPICSGRYLRYGESALTVTHPELVSQWDRERNGELRPEQFSAESRQRIWWRCPEGHRWRAAIRSRTAGAGCPVCAGKKIEAGFNDLSTTHPALAVEWNREKNGEMTPDMVGANSSHRIWWRCSAGHEWQASVASRTRRGTGCPYCDNRAVSSGENDLQALFPQIALEWDKRKNGALKPWGVIYSSTRRVWWLCPEGHSYRAAVRSRTEQGTGCPICAGKQVLPGYNDLKTVCPEIAEEWHERFNEGLTPEKVTYSSRKKVWWCCSRGHSWKQTICDRTEDGGQPCPLCMRKIDPTRDWRYRRMMERYSTEIAETGSNGAFEAKQYKQGDM